MKSNKLNIVNHVKILMVQQHFDFFELLLLEYYSTIRIILRYSINIRIFEDFLENLKLFFH